MKRGLILSIIVFAVVLSIIFIFVYINNLIIDYDYTELKDTVVFYNPIENILAHSTQTQTFEYGKETTSEISNRICIYILDKQFNPIKEGKIKIMNESGLEYVEVGVNEDGVLALNNLENDTDYYFEQTATKEEYSINSTTYHCKIDDKNSTYVLCIFNDKEEISKEERKELEKEFFSMKNIKTDKTDKTILLESEEMKKNESNSDKFQYIFLKDELNGLNLNIYKNYAENPNDSDSILKILLEIPGAEILNTQVEKLYDDTNIVEILDENQNLSNNFENDESFYIKYDGANYDNEIRYKLIISFKYKNKTYKISKIESFGITSTKLYGQIRAQFLDENGNPMPGTRVTLLKVHDNSDEEIVSVTAVEVGDSGQITFYKLIEGKYKIVTNYNNKNLNEKIIEVVAGEMTNVEIKGEANV